MMMKLISIGFALNMILCSIGVQVMHHDCIWCGGDRLEFISHQNESEQEDSCCSAHESSDHACHEGGCCKSELLKLTSGLTSEDGFVLKRFEVKTEIYDLVISLLYVQTDFYSNIRKDYWDKIGVRDYSPPPAFLSPLRC